MLNARAAVAGDLAVAATGRDTSLERVQAAQAEGQALLDAAKAQAEQLLTDAHTAVTDAQAGYAAALDAGWQPTELHRLGYPPPAGRRRRLPRTAAVAGSAAEPAPTRTPANDTGPDART